MKIDLGGHTITGDNADASKEAKPGLVFKKDDTATEHPGTNLEIVNGTIQGGSGSAAHPDGAAGVGEAAGSKPSQAGITVGADAVIKGGNGADGENGSNGGNGGSGIEGTIGTTVNGGSVFGGNGGKGSDSATGTPGNGGNGGSGIKTDKDVVINGGTITGGNAGNGGNATGENNTNPGGSGGNGGSGVNSGNGKIDNNGGTITGGARIRARVQRVEFALGETMERRTIRMAEQRPEETVETAVTPTMEETTETAAPVVKVQMEQSMEETRMVTMVRMVKSSS